MAATDYLTLCEVEVYGNIGNVTLTHLNILRFVLLLTGETF